MSRLTSSATVVQRHLDAFNARDLDAVVAVYAANAKQYEHPSTVVAQGTAEIRERYRGLFREPNLHARLDRRMTAGSVVIDKMTITRNFPQGPGTVEVVAIHEVQGDRIANIWYLPVPKSTGGGSTWMPII